MIVGGRFLVVEDDQLVARAMLRQLRPFGTSSHASNLAEATGILREEEPGRWSCMIIDLMLPDGNGLDALARARELGCTSPALVLTASRDLDNINRAFDLGARFLLKPFQPSRLDAFIQEALRLQAGDFAGSVAAWSKRYDLTGAEASVLEGALEGASHDELIQERGIRRSTLKTQINSLLRKTGDASLSAAVIRLLRERAGKT